MGEVYSPEQVASGAIPAAGGEDQEQAAAVLMNFVRSSPLTSAHARLLIPGSTATGQADRRSDVDYLLVDAATGPEGVPDLSPHRRELQARFIRETLDYAADYYNVRFEGQHYTEAQLLRMGRTVYDAFWISHGLDVQDNHPDFAHRQPLERLRPYAIGFKLPDDPERITLASAIAMRYMTGKVNAFSEAGDFNPSSWRDLRRLQRAFEAPKALARKMITMSALEGHEITDPDVTSKQSMKQQMDQILTRFNGGARLAQHIDRLAALDEEYDEVLDEAVRGDVLPYEKWLRDNYLPACAMALQLAEGCADHIDRITLAHPDVSFWTYGVDVESDLDVDFALQHSMSEPLTAPSASGDSPDSRPDEFSEARLINMSPEHIDAFLGITHDVSPDLDAT
jgi:predicted nucleotidyltransferase